MALLSSTHHDDDVEYSDDDCSTDSYLDYCQQEGDAYKRVDSYNFLHNTDTFTPMDILQDFDDEYYSYLNKNYNEFDNGFSLTHMRKLTDKDLANHIKEINNDVTYLNFDNIYSYEYWQMVVHKFDKIFQGILDADSSFTFSLSHYFLMDWYKDYFPKYS